MNHVRRHRVVGCTNHRLTRDCLICRQGLVLEQERGRRAFCPVPLPATIDFCEDCRQKYLRTGVALVHAETGRVLVMRDEAFRAIFDHPIPEDKIVYVEENVLAQITAVCKAIREIERRGRQTHEMWLN